MISQDTFLNELNANNINKDSEAYKKFLQVYDLYQIGGDSNTSYLVDDLLEYLFAPKLTNSDFYISSSFINSPIGNVLFAAKFNSSSNNLFTLTDVALLTNKTKSLISMDIKNKNLIVTKLGKGTFFISEAELITYMELKNFSVSSAKKKIHEFLHLKNQNIPLPEIKAKLNQE